MRDPGMLSTEQNVRSHHTGPSGSTYYYPTDRDIQGGTYGNYSHVPCATSSC